MQQKFFQIRRSEVALGKKKPPPLKLTSFRRIADEHRKLAREGSRRNFRRRPGRLEPDSLHTSTQWRGPRIKRSKLLAGLIRRVVPPDLRGLTWKKRRIFSPVLPQLPQPFLCCYCTCRARSRIRLVTGA